MENTTLTHEFKGTPTEIGSQIWERICLPIVGKVSRDFSPQQLGQIYGGFVVSALGAMRASSGRAAVVTMVERKSRLIRLVKVPRNTARAVSRAVISALAPIGTRVKSFTMDRGSEFAEHALIESVLAAKAYFADAYCAWQRGSNEQHNGLVRQYLPRRIALRGVNQEQIDDIEDKLNNRPRKTLGYRTPLEVFSDSFNCVALRS